MLDATRNTRGAESATAEAIEFIRDHPAPDTPSGGRLSKRPAATERKERA
ncbi:MAG: hypothetical protein JWO23_2829 [Solirubrobacterales bacterium]|nr:hypothetical protein [Solirubrobacterales bacterium]